MDRREFLAAAAALPAAGGRSRKTLAFEPGERRLLEPPVVDNRTLEARYITDRGMHEVRDCDLTIEGNGATLEVPRPYAGFEHSTVFALVNSSLTLRNLTLKSFAEDNNVPGTHARGVQWFCFTGGCRDVRVENVRVSGGQVIFGFGVRRGEPRRLEAVNVDIRGCSFEDAHYPVIFTGGGRLIRLSYRARRATRSLFLRNVRDCRAEVWSEDHYADDVLLSADNAAGYEAKSIEDVHVKYHNPGTSTHRYGVTLRFSASGSEGALARNIRIETDVGANVTPFTTLRQYPSDLDGGGATDGRSRGHLIENLTLAF